MQSANSKIKDLETLTPVKKKDNGRDYSSLSSGKKTDIDLIKPDELSPRISDERKAAQPTSEVEILTTNKKTEDSIELSEDLTYSEKSKVLKKKKKLQEADEILKQDNWMIRNAHSATFFGIYLFSFFVFFRPYELIPGLTFTQSWAFYIAAITFAIYLPTQLAAEGNLTYLSVEVKAVLAMTVIALITTPIAKDVALAWQTFSDTFIKAVLMFIIMVNVIRTQKRLKMLMWVSFAMSIFISVYAISLSWQGQYKTEGYRVSVDIKGLFENANEMAMHLVTMIPLALTFGIASKNIFAKMFYFSMSLLFLMTTVLTYSRGGFLALIFGGAFLVWKLGRDSRLQTFLISAVFSGLFILLAPGNYGLRVLSIFLPNLDPNGSANERNGLLQQSIIVSLRNPWGIGMNNFMNVSSRGLVTHNAYTQVSAELGVAGLIAYLIFILSPFRKLAAIERIQLANNKRDWFYYFSIGLQASLICYMISSFFASVAYIWYIYYLIAYAIAFRRSYRVANETEISEGKSLVGDWQTV